MTHMGCHIQYRISTVGNIVYIPWVMFLIYCGWQSRGWQDIYRGKHLVYTVGAITHILWGIVTHGTSMMFPTVYNVFPTAYHMFSTVYNVPHGTCLHDILMFPTVYIVTHGISCSPRYRIVAHGTTLLPTVYRVPWGTSCLFPTVYPHSI